MPTSIKLQMVEYSNSKYNITIVTEQFILVLMVWLAVHFNKHL